jgi:uncharacterized iron-regulated protein
MKILRLGLLALCPVFVPALHAGEVERSAVKQADIVLLGEQHDNASHHLEQARFAREIAPKALVFEMLTAVQVEAAQDVDRRDAAALDQAFGWSDSGWPAFEIYAPIFAAAPDAALYGGWVPRDAARAAMQNGIVESFGPEAERFGLTEALPDAEMQARLTLQFEAHCQAMPRDALAPMVGLQRLRDATLAQAALQALADTGGPVAVITGNGHARADWGATALIRRAAPEVQVFALGQGEAGEPPVGVFDQVIDGPAVDRGDPCDAFR